MKNIALPTIFGLALSPILMTPASIAEPVNTDADNIVNTAEATTPSFDTAKEIERVSVVTVQSVKVSDTNHKVKIDRAKFTAEAKPKPKPKPVEKPETTTTDEDAQEDATTSTTNTSSEVTETILRDSNESSKASTKVSATASSEASTGAYTRDSRNGVTKTYKNNEVKLDTSKETEGLSTVVEAAYEGIGSPYVWGGNTPSGWDCSGFVKWAYAKQGINIARGTSAILGSGQFTRTSTPQPGDLVFQNGGGHVGIYVGDGKMIGAQNPSVGTILHDVSRNPVYGYYTLKK